MNDLSLLILVQLILSHILTDFVFQPNSWIRDKRKNKHRSKSLYFHSALAGILAYLLLGRWNLWVFPIVIAITHFFIDLWKLHHKKDNLKIFILDQIWHLVVLFLIWIFLIEGFDELLPVWKNIMASSVFLIILSAYLVVIFPVGFLIGKATQRWQRELDSETQQESLESAGRFIGIFERILVLTFILIGNFSSIGFLIAAKSILRFSEKSETGARKQTEYVLIGTLMSFAITILIGLLVYHLAFQ